MEINSNDLLQFFTIYNEIELQEFNEFIHINCRNSNKIFLIKDIFTCFKKENFPTDEFMKLKFWKDTKVSDCLKNILLKELNAVDKISKLEIYLSIPFGLDLIKLLIKDKCDSDLIDNVLSFKLEESNDNQEILSAFVILKKRIEYTSEIVFHLLLAKKYHFINLTLFKFRQNFILEGLIDYLDDKELNKNENENSILEILSFIISTCFSYNLLSLTEVIYIKDKILFMTENFSSQLIGKVISVLINNIHTLFSKKTDKELVNIIGTTLSNITKKDVRDNIFIEQHTRFLLNDFIIDFLEGNNVKNIKGDITYYIDDILLERIKDNDKILKNSKNVNSIMFKLENKNRNFDKLLTNCLKVNSFDTKKLPESSTERFKNFLEKSLTKKNQDNENFLENKDKFKFIKE